MRRMGHLRTWTYAAGFALFAFPALAAPMYTVTALGTLGGPNSKGYGINASGQVTGWAQTITNHQHAFRFDGTTMQGIGTIAGVKSLTRIGSMKPIH